MSKSTIDAEAHMGTYEDFIEKFEEGDQYKKDSVGWTLLESALCNTNDDERYKIVNFLINKGADMTAIYKPHNTVMFKYIFNLYRKIPEVEMIPLYELIFSQEGLKVLLKDKWGLTPLDFAKKCERPIGVKYMEDYIERYNLKE